jgi:hypothetical protein
VRGQRDPDEIGILTDLRHGLDELRKNTVSRWGRVPHVTADPSPLVDGQVWMRSDLGQLCFRVGGVTKRVP